MRPNLRSVPAKHPQQATPALALTVAPDAIEAIAVRVVALLEPHVRANAPEGWIGVGEAAEHLACKPQRIYDLVSQRRLPYRRDGRRVLFRRTDLDEYLTAE